MGVLAIVKIRVERDNCKIRHMVIAIGTIHKMNEEQKTTNIKIEKINEKTDRVSIFLRKQTKLIGDKVTIGSRLRCFIS